MGKRYIKTYGAKGLLEWKMSLHTGKASVKIHFTGGSMGSNGVISAKYATANPAIQALIEESPQYKSGKVFISQKEEYESEDRRPGKESSYPVGGDAVSYV